MTCKGRLDACIIMHDNLKNLQEKRNENGTVMGRTVHKKVLCPVYPTDNTKINLYNGLKIYSRVVLPV